MAVGVPVEGVSGFGPANRIKPPCCNREQFIIAPGRHMSTDTRSPSSDAPSPAGASFLNESVVDLRLAGYWQAAWLAGGGITSSVTACAAESYARVRMIDWSGIRLPAKKPGHV